MGRPGPDLFSEDLDAKAILSSFVAEEDKRHLSSLEKSELARCSVRSFVQNAATVVHFGDYFLELQEELREAREEAAKQREELVDWAERVEEELKKTQEAQRTSEAKARQKLKLAEEKRKGLEKENQSLQDSLGDLQGQHEKILVGAADSLEELFANLKAQAQILTPGVDFSGMVIDGHVLGFISKCLVTAACVS